MTEKFNLEQVKDNLENLYSRLKLKGREKGFWVITDDFKPIKLRETIKGKEIDRTIVKIDDIKNELLKGREEYFKGKKLAFINFYIDKIYLNDPKEYNENRIEKIKNVILCSITIDIYVVDINGEIDTYANNEWRAKINFTVDDMMNHKLKIKDADKLMKQVSNKIITTSNFTGINYKDYVKLYIKKLNNLLKNNKGT